MFGVLSRFLCPGVKCDSINTQPGGKIPQEIQPLFQAVQKGKLNIRSDELHGDGGKTRSCPHIDQTGVLRQIKHGHGQQAVHKMLYCNTLIVCNGGEIDFLVPLLEHLAINGKF